MFVTLKPAPLQKIMILICEVKAMESYLVNSFSEFVIFTQISINQESNPNYCSFKACNPQNLLIIAKLELQRMGSTIQNHKKVYRKATITVRNCNPHSV